MSTQPAAAVRISTTPRDFAVAIMNSFRDQGGPHPEGDRRLSCDPNFNRYSAYWLLGPTLDATHMALETLSASKAGRSFIETHHRDILRFIGDSYVHGSGRFRTCPRPRTEGIFATHAAIGALKVTHGLPTGRPIGADEYRRLVVEAAGASAIDPVQGVLDLFREAAEVSPLPGTMIDNPNVPLVPTVTSLQTGYSLLWNLFDDEAPQILFDLLGRDEVLGFLWDCLKTFDVGEMKVTGFTIHPTVDTLCVNTSFFALRMIRRLGLWDELLDIEAERRVVTFLCQLGFQGRGFRSTLNEKISLNATHFGLEALSLFRSDGTSTLDSLVDEASESIHSFVKSCVRPDGGAAFGLNDLYKANCVATRYAQRILVRLPTTRDSEDLWRGFAAFCMRQFDEQRGGFSAYSTELPLPVEDAELIESKIEEKNDDLLGQRSWREEPDPLRKLHFRTDMVFKNVDRLLTLRNEHPEDPSVEERLAREVARLEELRDREAGLWKQQFDLHTLKPLKEGLDAMAGVDTFLAEAESDPEEPDVSHAAATD